jgi:hypothetical protein
VYDFVPDNYESLIDRGGGGGDGNNQWWVRPVGEKLVAVKGEEIMRKPRFERLLG